MEEGQAAHFAGVSHREETRLGGAQEDVPREATGWRRAVSSAYAVGRGAAFARGPCLVAFYFPKSCIYQLL